LNPNGVDFVKAVDVVDDVEVDDQVKALFSFFALFFGTPATTTTEST